MLPEVRSLSEWQRQTETKELIGGAHMMHAYAAARRRRGFTLREMLIAVAVCAALAVAIGRFI
jgi:prepilin-type N-terminal cleavage/methylation domain-containing protein